MDNQNYINELLNNSNYNDIKGSSDEFTEAYIKKLLENIILYVDSSISLGQIVFTDTYRLEQEISQEIIGVPAAYSAMDGNIKVLTTFAESYANIGITEYDSLCQDALMDFMNLHNGLFIVELSQNKICELSLSVPKQNGFHRLSSTDIAGKITVIPVNFKYGTINFILSKK